MMKYFTLLMTLLFVTSTAAQFNGAPTDESLTKTFTLEELEEIDSLKRGTVLKKRDVESGLFLSDYNTEKDANRTSFLYTSIMTLPP